MVSVYLSNMAPTRHIVNGNPLQISSILGFVFVIHSTRCIGGTNRARVVSSVRYVVMIQLP